VSTENPFYRPPRESTFADDEVRSKVRADFYSVKASFLDRLACARVFDGDRFEALLLWLDTLRRCCAAANVPMLESDFDHLDSISSYLEQEATYSKDQRDECALAYKRWLGIIDDFEQLRVLKKA